MKFRNDKDRMQPLTVFSQASLTDVVMLLLIFFLLTSSFVTHFGIKVDIPKAITGAQTQNSYISVAITKAGIFYVEGEQVSASQLSSAIRKARQNKPEGTLVLRADKNAVINDAVRVMNIAKALRLKIIMATEKGTQ